MYDSESLKQVNLIIAFFFGATGAQRVIIDWNWSRRHRGNIYFFVCFYSNWTHFGNNRFNLWKLYDFFLSYWKALQIDTFAPSYAPISNIPTNFHMHKHKTNCNRRIWHRKSERKRIHFHWTKRKTYNNYRNSI